MRFLLLCLGLCLACHGPEPLRVLSYNIHHGEGVDGKLDLARIADLIAVSEADLVALQEVDRGVQRTKGVDQVGELARQTGLEPAFAKFMDYQGGEYGLAILSRLPVLRSWPIPLPPGKHEPRAALAVEVECEERGKLLFVCLHFDWLDDDSSRFEQARALLTALGEVSSPVILAGDFNDRLGSRSLESLGAEFSNVPKLEGRHLTFSSREPVREIDFIMVRPAGVFEGRAWTIPEPNASDHLPVLAELR